MSKLKKVTELTKRFNHKDQLFFNFTESIPDKIKTLKRMTQVKHKNKPRSFVDFLAHKGRQVDREEVIRGRSSLPPGERD